MLPVVLVGVGVGLSQSSCSGMGSDDENVIVRLQVKSGGAVDAGASPYDAIESDAFASVPMDVPIPLRPLPLCESALRAARPLTALFGRPTADRGGVPSQLQASELAYSGGCCAPTTPLDLGMGMGAMGMGGMGMGGMGMGMGGMGMGGMGMGMSMGGMSMGGMGMSMGGMGMGGMGMGGVPGPAGSGAGHARGPAAASAAPMASNVVRLLAEFGEKSKNREWPMSTSVHCYWCCHQFDTMPFGLPLKYSGGQFHVVGCFCSLECASAYNFASNKDSVDESLNRYSLINALSATIGLGRVVRPAPDRLSLAIFGGHLDIERFRDFGRPAVVGAEGPGHRSTVAKSLIVNIPPMQSLTQQVEEVNQTDLCSEYRYIPIDSDRVSRYQEKVRLMRTKPLINFKNTLDHTMKLKYTEKV